MLLISQIPLEVLLECPALLSPPQQQSFFTQKENLHLNSSQFYKRPGPSNSIDVFEATVNSNSSYQFSQSWWKHRKDKYWVIYKDKDKVIDDLENNLEESSVINGEGRIGDDQDQGTSDTNTIGQNDVTVAFGDS